MKNYLFSSMSLLALAVFLVHCKKDDGEATHFRISLTNFSTFVPGTTADVYCLVTREDGSTAATRHFTVEFSVSHSLEVEVADYTLPVWPADWPVPDFIGSAWCTPSAMIIRPTRPSRRYC